MIKISKKDCDYIKNVLDICDSKLLKIARTLHVTNNEYLSGKLVEVMAILSVFNKECFQRNKDGNQ